MKNEFLPSRTWKFNRISALARAGVESTPETIIADYKKYLSSGRTQAVMAGMTEMTTKTISLDMQALGCRPPRKRCRFYTLTMPDGLEIRMTVQEAADYCGMRYTSFVTRSHRCGGDMAKIMAPRRPYKKREGKP